MAPSSLIGGAVASALAAGLLALAVVAFGAVQLQLTTSCFNYWAHAAAAVPAFATVVFLYTRAWTRHLIFATVGAMSNFVYSALLAANGFIACKQVSNHYLVAWLSFSAHVSCDLYTLVTFQVMFDGIYALESSLPARPKARCMRLLAASFWAFGCGVALYDEVTAQVLLLCFETHGPLWYTKSKAVLHLIFAALPLPISVLYGFMLSTPVRMMRKAARILDGERRSEAHLAELHLWQQIAGIPLTMVPKVLTQVAGTLHRVPEYHKFATLRVLLCALGLVLLSGALRAKMPDREAERRRELKRAALCSRWKPNPDGAWHAKVVELAGRGISLEALLEFYLKIKLYMPDYTPDVHTTRDVVRRAIIPASRRGRCALASVLMGGAYTRPTKMVTHAWGNLFRDLLAAIVADALGDATFNESAELLDHRFDDLLEMLEARGAMQQAYWVCAFSVSQHNAICGGNPYSDTDPVSGIVHPVCDCGAPKYWNTTEPLRADQRSIPCEMNKFADMIEYLAATSENFEQVIAADMQIGLFHRAWVIAEVAQSHTCGLMQRLKLHSVNVIHEREDTLRDLKVEEMQASRPEDVTEILSGIPDKGQFNAQLQRMIFDDSTGLIASWKSLDSVALMHRIGRLTSHAQTMASCYDSDSSSDESNEGSSFVER